jgi:hypothetical protein
MDESNILSKKRIREPLAFQYLGVRGSTHECVAAMLTILTSPYPCDAITMLVLYPERKMLESTAASFIVWRWLGTDVTVVPDGFSTAAGTGGWGLTHVVRLIEYLQIPLTLKKVRNSEQFDRINDGRGTERDWRQIRSSDEAPLYWQDVEPYDIESASPTDFRGDQETFPYWLLEPEMLSVTHDFLRDPDGAVFNATRRLEIIIREKAGLDESAYGVQLVERALGEAGVLTPLGATLSEIKAWTELFKSVMGAFRNPQGHREVALSAQAAVQQIVTVNMLLAKLKKDHPDLFALEHPSR